MILFHKGVVLYEKNCEVCNKEFDVKPSTYERRKTCSRECFSVRKSQKIECNCGYCGEKIFKTKSQIEKSTSGKVFCNNKCVGKYNQEERKQDITISCVICGKKVKSIEARKFTHITCSNECQGIWQSEKRVGENASNYRGGGKTKSCEYCNEEYFTSTPYDFSKRRFCSVDCKVKHWKENTLHNEEFKKAHFKGNLEYRKKTKETKPERLVREYLESQGLVKDKDFKQEQGFFRKYFADFFIFKTKTIIEVDGDYWHGNPKFYGEGLTPLYESQKERMELDKEKESAFVRFGFNFHRVWESDIYEDIEKSLKDIKIK